MEEIDEEMNRLTRGRDDAVTRRKDCRRGKLELPRRDLSPCPPFSVSPSPVDYETMVTN